MSEYKKISRWISEIEENLQIRREERAKTEARIAKRINHIVLDAVSNEFWLPQDKVALCNRLSRMARILEAEDNDMSTLKQVEKEVEKIYGDQSDNTTYYFSGKSARSAAEEEEHGDNWYERGAGEKEKKEMEDLSTYDEDTPENKDVRPEKDFEGVQKAIKKDKEKQKESSWSDFAPTQVSFEDDGEYIDDGDGLSLDVPDEYDFDPKEPLDELEDF